jgi:carboxyl-terminal processing protease
LERLERERSQTVSVGAYIDEIEGKPVVVHVEPESEAARAGVEPGMIVSTIDGVAVRDRLRELRAKVGGSSTERAVQLRLYHKMLEGDPGTRLALGLTRDNGSVLNAVVTRRTVSDAPRVVSRWLASGYGYLKLTLWKSPVHDQFRSYLEKFSQAPGLIIDLRGNPGGEVNEVLKIAGYFFPTKVPFGRFVTRSGKNLDLFTGHDGAPVYGGPVAILLNEASGSGSEMFSGVMQETGRAIVVGRQSCGCLLGISQYKRLKGGGELAISELGYVSPRGKQLEGVGVIPDESVNLTLSDLQHRRDAAIDVAQNVLGNHHKTFSGSH